MEARNKLLVGLINTSICTTSICATNTAYNNDHHVSSPIAYTVEEAFKRGTTAVDFRLRYEQARQLNLKEAKATTLRTKLGYSTAYYSDLGLHLELIDVSSIFGQKYNPNVTGLTKAEYSLVQDPKGTGITVANLHYRGIDKTDIKFGKQYIELDNQRWIGSDDFRQFPMTFDAVSLKNSMFDNFEFFYAYLTHANNNLSNGSFSQGRNKLNTHLINASWHGFNYGILSGYLYLNKDKAVNTNSNLTTGFRAVSDDAFVNLMGATYAIEVARQQGKFNHPTPYSGYYEAIELGKKFEFFNFNVGYERLDGHASETGKAVQSPLGSKHGFLGLAEAFSTTPDQGIQDIYLKATFDNGEFKIGAAYHHFRKAHSSNSQGKKAGNEFDVYGSVKLNENVDLHAAYANYNPSNQVALKARRVWVMLTAKVLPS